MSDEQWLWLFVNQSIDSDEKFESMCPDCQNEVTSGVKKCIRCGKEINGGDSFVNPNFDIDKYNRLAGIIDDDEYDEPQRSPLAEMIERLHNGTDEGYEDEEILSDEFEEEEGDE